MGIGSITSMNNMPARQMSAANLKDQKAKIIQGKITDAQKQIQNLSSKEDLSANEKINERKKLQKEISSLNTELRQHQEELSRSQKREILMEESQEDKNLIKEDKSEDKIPSKETSSDTTVQKELSSDKQQAAQQETIITQNSDGTVLLKGSQESEKNHGIDKENKQAAGPKEKIPDEKETKTKDDMTEDINPSSREIHAMVSSGSSLQQASRLGTIVTQTRDGIAILKGEIKQDELLGGDTERKQAELEKMEKKEQRAIAFQFSVFGDADNAIRSAAETDDPSKDNRQANIRDNLIAFNMPQEEDTSQQQFYVSVG